MTNCRLGIVLITGLLLLLSACDSVTNEEPETRIARPGSVGETPESAGSCVSILGYQICLTDVATSTEHTAFEYTVTGLNETAHFNHLVIGYEVCEPALVVESTLPSGTWGEVDAVTGIYGVLFSDRQRRNETKVYTLTFAGEVATGVVEVGAEVSGQVAKAWVSGAACEPISYDVSGSVYIESDMADHPDYGLRDAEEAGVADVTVQLTGADGLPVLDASGAPFSVLTDEDGAFTISSIPPGSYYLTVPASTDFTGDNNETLYLVEGGPLYTPSHSETFVLPTGAAVPVTLGPDATLHLGFAPNAEAIEAALLGDHLSTRNTLPFDYFLPLIAGLSSADDIAKKKVPTYSVEVGSYAFGFLGRTYDPTKNVTTYAYGLERTAPRGSDVNHVTFGVEECTPAGYNSSRVTLGYDPTTGVSGAKFDFLVKQKQTYLLHFAGDVEPGVIDVGVKYGQETMVVKMPGACAGSIGTVSQLIRSLEKIYYSGPGDTDFLFLPDPLVLPPGKSELAAAIGLLSLKNVEAFSLEYLQQYLLAALLIFDRGYGTSNHTFDLTLFQFVEPIILLESQTQNAAGKSFGIQAGTGGSLAGGSVLGGYLK